MITLTVAKNSSNSKAMIDRAVTIASFYGFVPFEDAPLGEQAVVSGRVFRFDPKSINFARREERRLVSAIRTCALRGLGDRRMPAFLFKLTPGDKGTDQAILELHVIGMKSVAAEALLITVSDAIAQELGIDDRLIRVNSIGTGESANRYIRELTSFLRKQSEHLTATQRERIQDDPIGTLLSIRNKEHPIMDRIPSSMDHLNDDERRHFWDVLEYLEFAGKKYELSPTLVGSNECWAHTLFEMSYPQIALSEEGDPEQVTQIPFALGGRYDTLAERSLGPGATAVQVAITFETKNIPSIKRRKKKPSAFFAHLGLEAKRRSIPVLEILRHAEIPVYHSLAYDQLGPQMETVGNLNIPWLLLMGQKEALEGEVAVRNIKANTQNSVPINSLVDYLRRKHVTT
jgi:histidyl-tRNA synthetase